MHFCVSRKRGWFGGDPVDIFLLSKQERAERFKELGEQNGANSEDGIVNILNVAEQRLKQSRLDANRIAVEIDVEIQWSLELSMTALRLTEPHTPCTTEPCPLHVLALKLLAASAKNPNARNYYLLACAMKLTTKGFVRKIGRKFYFFGSKPGLFLT